MYKILHFSGGVYKFDLLAEHVEDIGGLIIPEKFILKSRGSYFLSEEIQVIFIVPPSEVSNIELWAKEIKGEIREVDLEEPLKSNLITLLNIYDILCKARDWVTTDILKSHSGFNDNISKSKRYNTNLNSFSRPSGKHLPYNLEKCLDLMLSLKLIEKREKQGKVEHRVKLFNDKRSFK